MHDTEAPTMTQAEQDAAAWRSTAGRYLSALEVAERSRDEVGIQLAAAQAEIARMRPVVEAARTMSAMWLQDSPRMTDYHVTLASALRALDTVPGDALERP